VSSIRAFAPGRVNLIGDHTDHTGGLVLPMAIDLGTQVVGERGGEAVQLRSEAEPAAAEVALDVTDATSVDPPWARYVAGVVAELRPAAGFRGTVATTLPLGGGLSSSAALEVAVALALGAPADDPTGLALLCQRAEQRASGVPCGVMDQLASVAGVDGCALLIDCHALSVDPIPLPGGVEVLVVHSGEPRALAGSAYAERRAQCEAAEALIGPLRLARPEDAATITDPLLRRRARHVTTENERVRAFASALRGHDLLAAGSLMVASHQSLRDDFEVSTPGLDGLVARLCAQPGVLGARLTGAGFGGCIVALVESGAAVDAGRTESWRVRASAGARLEVGEPGA
jgi:galactokinase